MTRNIFSKLKDWPEQCFRGPIENVYIPKILHFLAPFSKLHQLPFMASLQSLPANIDSWSFQLLGLFQHSSTSLTPLFISKVALQITFHFLHSNNSILNTHTNGSQYLACQLRLENTPTASLQRSKHPNEATCWQWMATYNAWGWDPDGWAFCDLVIEVVTWPTTLHFSLYWLRQAIGKAAGHIKL